MSNLLVVAKLGYPGYRVETVDGQSASINGLSRFDYTYEVPAKLTKLSPTTWRVDSIRKPRV